MYHPLYALPHCPLHHHICSHFSLWLSLPLQPILRDESRLSHPIKCDFPALLFAIFLYIWTPCKINCPQTHFGMSLKAPIQHPVSILCIAQTHTYTQPNNVWHCVISECRHNAFTYEYILAFTTKHQWINIYVYKSDFHGLHLVSEQQPPRTTPLYPSRFLCELVNIFRTHPFMLYIIRILVV